MQLTVRIEITIVPMQTINVIKEGVIPSDCPSDAIGIMKNLTRSHGSAEVWHRYNVHVAAVPALLLAYIALERRK
ncbi:hypothetical protein E2P81_ATG00185 [Venturia nashicola]|uniref:Uncharacterized protein n=1 Tax=Venturia nashicola TaxID=86259 RepID=A0A4Z1PFQ9_9PEZI|nr:hypothetical protein E6O75_ATG00193 [Venturia nashicola]TLD39198.1 hypothetical protein E2P81_ATG00185 [Venturia nashicola]